MPEWVACVGHFKEFRFGPVQFSVKFMGTFPKFTARWQHFTRIEVKPNERNVKHPQFSWFRCHGLGGQGLFRQCPNSI